MNDPKTPTIAGSKTLTIAKREFIYNVTRREYLFILLGLPLLLLLIFGMQNFGTQALKDTSANGGHIGVFDAAGLNISIGNLTAYSSQADLAAALANKSMDRGLVIGSDYWQSGNITILKRTGDLSLPSFNAQAQALINAQLALRAPPAIAARLLSGTNFQTINVDAQGNPAGPDDLTPMIGIGVGVLLIFSIFMSSGYLLRSVVDEKENRLIEVLLSSVSAQELMTGKIMGLALLTLTQVVVWMGMALLIVPLAYPNLPPLDLLRMAASFATPSALLAYLLLPMGSFLVFSSLLAGLGAIATSLRSVQSLTAVVIIPAVCPVWFISLFMADPNNPICLFLSFFPLSAPLAMMLRLAFGAVPLWQLVISTLLVWAAAWACLWASAKVFRASLLIYGKTPGLTEIVSFIKSA